MTARLGRRGFIGGAAAFALAGCRGVSAARRPVRFLFMSDTHVERDFMERGREVYTCWRPGNHAALVKTYEFINSDPFCRDVDFAFFCGDQLNTGYTREQAELEAELAIWNRTLDSLDVHAKSKGEDLSSFRFAAAPWTCRENLGKGDKPFDVVPPPLVSRAIAIQGNHDTGVRDFYRDCAFTAGDTRFIAFFAMYVGLKPRPGDKYNSTGAISDETMAFVEREMKAASADPACRHIVLFCHWAIAPRSRDFIHPIVDACQENRMNDNRRRLLDLAEKCGCDLFINGHEHNSRWPFARFGRMADVNCGTVTNASAAFAVVEIGDTAASFCVYSRAKVSADGSLVANPRRQFSFEVPIAPLRGGFAAGGDLVYYRR